MGRVEVNGILDRVRDRDSDWCYNRFRYTDSLNQVWHFAGGNDMKNIKELIVHIEEQIAHEDAREPNAQWIVGELKKYLVGKESCQWCGLQVDDKVMVEMGDDMTFQVCQACALDYAKENYEKIKTKIKEVNPLEGVKGEGA